MIADRTVRRTFWWSMLLLVTSSLSLLAKPPWEKKPFTEWGQEEITRVLRKSPWGKTHLFIIRGIDPGPPRPAQFPSESQTGDINREGRGTSAPRPSSQGENPAQDIYGQDSEQGDLRTVRAEKYRVVWSSSLTARKAISRMRSLRGVNLQAQMRILARQAKDHYVISLVGSVTRFFRHAELKELQSRTYLVSKRKPDKKIKLEQFALPRRGFSVARFYFRRDSGGAEPFDLTDREVRFTTSQGPMRVKADFKLKKMVVAGKLDL